MPSSARLPRASRAAHIGARRRGVVQAARRDGMTLVEVLIVIIIMALAAGGATIALGSVTRAKLRQAAGRSVAAARFAYHRAVTQGRTVRIVFDLENGMISFEEADGRVYLAQSDDPTRLAMRDDEAAIDAVDPWSAAEARLENTLRPSFGRSAFGPISDSDGEAIERYQARPIGDDIRIIRFFSAVEENPRESGRASLYFFPSGRTQRAVVHLADNADRVYSVAFHPLTGRGRVYPFAYEPEEIDDEGEARDPG